MLVPADKHLGDGLNWFGSQIFVASLPEFVATSSDDVVQTHFAKTLLLR